MRVKQLSNNLEIKECPVLGGIDTLYAFLDTDLITNRSKQLYQILWQKANNGIDFAKNYTFLNYSGMKSGFIGAWYLHTKDNIPLFRIGFKDPNKQFKVKNIYIQFYAAGIYWFGFKKLIEFTKNQLNDLLDANITNDMLLPSRVDLNAFIGGYDFSSIDIEMFRTTSNKSLEITQDTKEFTEDNYAFTFNNRRRLETLYVGARTSPMFMKIYDKKLELTKNQDDISNQIKNHFLIKNGFNQDEVWNLEFTIKREVLKQFSIFTLADLYIKAKALFKFLMLKHSFLGYDTDKINKYRNNKNISKLDISPLWQHIIDNWNFLNTEFVDIERSYKEITKGSKHNALGTIERIVRRQLGYNIVIDIDDFSQILKNLETV